MRRPNDSLIFDSLQLEGGLFVPAILEKAARGEHDHQKAADYALPKGLSLLDEQGRAFRIASALWKNFTPVRARSDIDAAKATEGFVTELLRDTLGYTDIHAVAESIEIDTRAYPITLMARGCIPVIVAPHDMELDTPDERFAVVGSGARRKSAYQLAQQFLNASESCTWAIATNGLKLRILRDADTLTRPTYLEVDLELILRDKRYADFAAVWRLLHATRASAPGDKGDACIWEQWKLEGQAQGQRIRSAMRIGVTSALQTLGDAFLQHRENEALRQRLQEGSLSVDAYFQQLLRLVYRFLFLFTIEERNLLHVEDDSHAARTARQAYTDGYAMRRLRDRALRRAGFDKHTDIWESVRIVFRGLTEGEPRLALPALGGLFGEDQCPDLDKSRITNRALLQVMRDLRWSAATGHLSAVDFRNMGPEELGSVYESLLELVPTVDLATKSFGFVGITDDGRSDGNMRKTTGSYYTPDSLVQQLLDTALDPVIEERVAAHPENPTQAILDITVIDPACGSGHFLLGAARRLAERLAELRAVEGAVHKNDYYHALREVIAHCIYGVDRNPMALELARTALWLEGFEPGQPLSFLGHHLICGDALLGLTDFKQLENGIPKDAFKPLSGDDKAVCKSLAATNSAALKDLKKRLKDKTIPLFAFDEFEGLFKKLSEIENMPDDTTRRVKAKERADQKFREDLQKSSLAHAADLFVAAFLAPKNQALASPGADADFPAPQLCIPTTQTLLDVRFPEAGTPPADATIQAAQSLCREASVLHWPLAFAHIFARGGFDCVLGNPPWERIKLQEQEFFASRHHGIATAQNKAARERSIQALRTGSEAKQRLYRDFIEARRLTEAMSAFAHVNGPEGGRFPLTGVGDVNTYALFAETIQKINASSGRAGFIVPTGIATDDSTKAFFSSLPEKHRLVSLYDFENREKIFEAVDSRMKFCLITLGPSEAAQFAFFLLNTKELEDARRSFTLSADDFTLINPNTRTCPVFRSQADAELTKKIYRQVPVLIEEARDDKPENPWGISFSAMFHMSGDSGVFLDQPEPGTLPLYEAKMMHQFDHRWATYYWDNEKNAYNSRDVTPDEKADPAYAVRPRYWVQEREVIARIARAPKCVLQAWLARDDDALRNALAIWIDSANEADLLDGLTQSTARDRVIEQGGPAFGELSKNEKDWLDTKAVKEAQNWPPLSESELAQIQAAETFDQATTEILDHRSPRWLMGWRDICRSTDERTVIASVIPRAGVNHKMPLIYTGATSVRHDAALLANLDSLCLDFVARQKVGGTSLTYHYVKQFPVLPPEHYTEADLDYIVPRVLELTYTSHDLAPWAADLGHSGQPFAFDPDRRAQLRAELDAYYAKLYGLTDAELRYILDPIDTHGEDYPSLTFPGLRKNDIKNHGHYRTRDLVLEAWKDLNREPVEAETIRPQELRIPDFPRKPNTEKEILIYATALLYAWLIQAGGPVRVRELGRALSLLKTPKRLIENAPAEHTELAKQWSKSFREPIKLLTLRHPIEEIWKRGQLRITQDDRNEFLLSLQEDARPQNIPKWVALDAGLSLKAARHELDKEPSIDDEVDELESVDTYLAQLTPQP